MSWQAALASPVFLTFFWICTGLLAAGGIALAVMRFGLRKDPGHAWQSFQGWLMMVPLFLGAVFLGRTTTIVFFAVVAMLGFKEFARSTGLYRDWWMTIAVYLGIVACALTTLCEDPIEDRPGWLNMYMALPAWVVPLILVVPILRNRSKGQLQTIALAIIGFLYIGWMFGHLALLTNSRNAYGYVMYLVVAVEANDIAAYTCGKLFGKSGRHPLRSNISPNKTLEGCLGAVLVSTALPFAFQFALPDFNSRELLLTGLIIGIGGQLGDLSISLIKRDLGIKDMGALIPGHGGVMDRIDSLIFVSPLFFHMMNYFHGLYKV